VVRQAEALRDAYALAKGYTAWVACPAPVAALIEAAVELRLFRRALFRVFYAGGEVPKRYDAIVELERRVLSSLGIEPAAVEDVAAILARMGHEEHRR
jgi:hypothetical protein